MNSDLFIISLTKTASFSKHSPDVGILDPQNGFANSCRRLKPDIFEFNSGPVHTIPVILPGFRTLGSTGSRSHKTGHFWNHKCCYPDSSRRGHTVFLPGFRTLRSTGFCSHESGHFWNHKYCYPDSCGRGPYGVLPGFCRLGSTGSRSHESGLLWNR